MTIDQFIGLLPGIQKEESIITEKSFEFLHLSALSVVCFYKSKMGLKLDLNLQPADLNRRFLRSLQDRSPCPSGRILRWTLAVGLTGAAAKNKSSFSFRNLVSVNIIFFPHGHGQMCYIPLVPEAAEQHRVPPLWERVPKQLCWNPIRPETRLEVLLWE